jgi:Zn-dependent protease with chaperone function
VVRARFFDGRTSRARDVVLRPHGDELAIEGEGVALRISLDRVEVAEPLEHAPRLLALPGGARCEIEPGPSLDLLLDVLGHREGRVSRWQRRWSLAVASALAVLALLAGGYRFGLPWIAERAAIALPEEAVRMLGAHTLEALDELVFEETALPPQRRSALAARLEALHVAEGVMPAYTLHFRAGGRIGANAFALPGGEIVVTDELVALARSDEEVLGVLAHELGHLHERHALRSLIQSSVVGVFVAFWLGDVTPLGTGLPTAVLEAKYSRDFEREADTYAAAVLRASGLQTRPFADLLARLEASRGTEAGALDAYLASHPATAERIRSLAGDAGSG